ncbi:MAG: Rieske (2Fe-2S) protein [Bacteroidetes bacterium]|nr:Rieske (2Fe-2S) protein [Bacteroidota bacterium]
MERKEFLALVGTSFAAITLASCLGSCKKEKNAQPTVDFTLDLTAAANSALATNGGYIYSNSVIVARTMAGGYIAVAQACPHQGVSVVYQPSSGGFYCSAHGSAFSASGAVTAGPAGTALKQYTCDLSGTSLHVHG